MIYGIGTDIVAVARMQTLWRAHAERGMEKILAPDERSDCLAAPDPGRFMAKRFAAKEALGKALGTGIRPPVLLQRIGVTHDSAGKPEFVYFDELSAHIAQNKLHAHLSLSDEDAFVVAFVIVEQMQ